MNDIKMTGSTTGYSLAVLAWITAVSAGTVSSQASAQQGSNGTDDNAQAVRVEVVQPSRRTMVRELKTPGTLIADERVDLVAKASGYVEEIKVDIGDRVRKGAVLVQLAVPEMADELRQAEAILQAHQAEIRALKAKAIHAQRMVETAKAQVQQDEARHELDQLNLERKQELRAGNAIPEQELDEARSAHAVTEAQLRIAHAQVAGAEAEQQAVLADVEVAKAQLLVRRADLARLETLMEYATIKAPFDGVITARNADHGTFVRSAAEGTTLTLLRIAKTDRIRVVLEIPEIDAPFVRIGTPVTIDVKALGEHPLPGTVSRTAQALKPETRTMRAEVDMDNADSRFAPGMYAQVVVQLQSKAQATLVPSKAIRLRGKDSVVLVVVDGVARSRTVEIGYDDGIWAEILSGLTGGESVITATRGTVTPGVAVEPVVSDAT